MVTEFDLVVLFTLSCFKEQCSLQNSTVGHSMESSAYAFTSAADPLSEHDRTKLLDAGSSIFFTLLM